MWRRFVRRLTTKAGYRILNLESVPYGVFLEADLKRMGALDRIRTVVDVGANVGQAALWFEEIFPQAQIHALEPFPHTFETLRSACQHAPRIRTHALALGAKAGVTTAYAQNNSRLNSLVPELQGSAAAQGQAFELQVDTLDHFCQKQDIPHIDLLKVDVEGFELQVLQGAQGLLKQGAISHIYIEATFNPGRETRYTPFASLTQVLEPYGFSLMAVYNQAAHTTSHMSYADLLFTRPG